MNGKNGVIGRQDRNAKDASAKLVRAGSIPQYVALIGVLATLISFTLTGRGNLLVIAISSISLSVIGIFQQKPHFSWKIVGCLLVLCMLGFISNYIHFGVLFKGYIILMFSCIPLYMLTRCLDEELSHILLGAVSIWCGLVAVCAIISFASDSIEGHAFRLDMFGMGSNVLGIFLVMGFFSALSYQIRDMRSTSTAAISLPDALNQYVSRINDETSTCASERGILKRAISKIVPLCIPAILAATALTMSVGSFIALFAGIVFLAVYLWLIERDLFTRYVSIMLSWASQAFLGLAAGMLVFIASSSDSIIMLLINISYVIALCIVWDKISSQLYVSRVLPRMIVCLIPVASAAVVFLRPNALNTFTDRIDMMGNAVSHLFDSPLIGLGEYSWMNMNANDGSTFFNTTYVHNGFLHYGVELGIAAMIILVVIAIICFMRKTHLAQQGTKAAFLFHIMFDVSLFSPIDIASFICATVPDEVPENVGKNAFVSRVIFVGMALSSVLLTVGAI